VALHAPQLIVGARMLYLVWLPADPEAARAGLLSLRDRMSGVCAEFHGALEPSETVLRARLADQAELQGTLARLQEQGLELLEVKRITRRR